MTNLIVTGFSVNMTKNSCVIKKGDVYV